jgi:sigma-E factor negative regulatory protein RseA
MKDRISALMDGELDDKSAAELIETLGRDREARLAWASYHLISDAMREGRLLSEGFGARLSERLAAEPTVLAPRSRQPDSKRWYALSAAASLAAVALVGWLAFAPQPASQLTIPAPVAQAPA